MGTSRAWLFDTLLDYVQLDRDLVQEGLTSFHLLNLLGDVNRLEEVTSALKVFGVEKSHRDITVSSVEQKMYGTYRSESISSVVDEKIRRDATLRGGVGSTQEGKGARL